MKKVIALIISLVIPASAGTIGAYFTEPAITSGWYAGLAKSTLNPPGAVFGPVWTALYALMGIAAFLVWRMGWERKDVRIALYIFGVQLFLNSLWSIIFFGFKNPMWALVDIILLWIAIVWTIVHFYRISRPAAYLLVPYILWVSFAIYLNLSVWILN